MYCKKCGFENDDSSKFCKNCGEALNIHSSFKKYNSATQKDNSNDSSKNILIICLTLIIISLLIAGAVLYTSNNNADQNNVPTSNDVNSSPAPESTDNNEAKNTEVTSAQYPLKIVSGSFRTDSPLPSKTYITVYVGAEHAGENVKIRVFYSNGGTRLNAGNIVPKTVDSSGYFTMRTANELNTYPDHASITLYDGNGNVVDTQEVNMNPIGGTQTF